MRLAIAVQVLTESGETLQRRLHDVPNGWRDMRLIQTKTDKLFDEVLKTVPLEQFAPLQRALRECTYSIGHRGPVGKNRAKFDREYGEWLPYEVINELVDGVHEKCLICMANKEEQGKCPLRKALDVIPNDAPERDDGGCPYMDVTV